MKLTPTRDDDDDDDDDRTDVSPLIVETCKYRNQKKLAWRSTFGGFEIDGQQQPNYARRGSVICWYLTSDSSN